MNNVYNIKDKTKEKGKEKKEFPLKRVFILGAGCSVEDGVPLIDNFFEELEKNYEPSSDINVFKNNYRLHNANIEEFLGYLDLHISLNSKFAIDTSDPSKGYFDLQKMRDELVALIGYTVEKKTKLKITGRHSEKYGKFFRQLNEHDVVISFNWDVLLDTVFFDYNLMKAEFKGNPIDYGEEFYMIGIDDDEDSYLPKKVGIKLLKLHGSLNWFYCPSCQKRFFTFRPNLYEDYRKGKIIKCPECKKENLKHLIVPPTFLKRFDKEGFSPLIPIWQEAFKALQECDKLIIAGYSFPQDDVHFKHFLRSSLSTRDIFAVQPPLPIEVINYKKYLNEKSEFENHYKDIFEGISHQIEPIFNYKKFSKYIDSL